MVDLKGHWAQAPKEIPLPGWKDILARTYKRTWDDNVGLVAAGVAFYGFFALLSMLALIVLVYGLAADPVTVIKLMRTLTAILPGDVALLIRDQLLTIVHASSGSKGFGILLAFAVAVYGGTNGATAVITALNIAYEEKEKRGLLNFYLLAVAMTLAGLLIALTALAATAAIAFLERLLPTSSPGAVLVGQAIGYVMLGLVAAAIVATVYRVAPARQDARWEWITPGSVLVAVVWLALTSLFGFYLANIADYRASYGSLGTVVALLTWMYLSAYTFLVGAELNSEIEHQTAKDSTTGAPEPLGERGAWAADNVATDDTVQDRPEEQREGERLTQAAPKVADEKG